MKTKMNISGNIMMALMLLIGAMYVSAQTWSPAPSITKNREFHTATLLPNGKVLVAGGRDLAGPTDYTQVCELYNSATNAWSAAASITKGRISHTATLLASGKVLITGGVGSDSVNTTSCEVYDPITNTWTLAASLITSRYSHTATLLPDGKVLVAGGDFLGSCELYDPVTDTWNAAPSMLIGRINHTATLLPNGKVLVIGGINYEGQLQATCELYDPVTNTWSVDSVGGARSRATATLLSNGKVLVTGGESPDSTSSCELYDPVTSTWNVAASMANVRAAHTATLLSNGYVLVAGGSYPSAISNSISSAELYNPVINSWITADSMANSRYAHTATLLPDAKVLVTGGEETGSGTLANCELYGFSPCSPPVFSVCPGNVTSGTATVSYTATISSNPPPMVTYSFTGATVANGSGTGSGSSFNVGITRVVITASNGCCTETKCQFSVKISKSSAAKIIDDAESVPFKVIVQPNPAKNQFTLLINGGSNEKKEVFLYDIFGRMVKHLEKLDGQSVLLGDELAVGQYFVKVKQGANQQTVQLIKRE